MSRCVVMFISHVAVFFFFFKQKTAYELRISDWSSDVCSSDLLHPRVGGTGRLVLGGTALMAHLIGYCRTEARQCNRQRTIQCLRPLTATDHQDVQRVVLLAQDRKSVVEGRSVTGRVDLGGRRVIKKKKKKNTN